MVLSNLTFSYHVCLFFVSIQAGIPATTYHAGLKDKERKEIQKQWTDGVYKVAVATVRMDLSYKIFCSYLLTLIALYLLVYKGSIWNGY